MEEKDPGIQEHNPHDEKHVRRHPVWVRLILVVFVLLLGFGGMRGLAALQKEPSVAEPEVPVITVSGVKVNKQDIQVKLEGYGSARPYRMTEIIPQVAGRIVYVHPNLNTGNIVSEGDVLFRIEKIDFEIAVREARAGMQRLEQELAAMRQRKKNDERLLEIAQRSKELQEREVDRIEALVESSGAASVSRLEETQQSLTQEQNKVTTLQNSLDLYPAQIDQLEAQLESARAQLERAETNLERTTVEAPFTGRIESKRIDLYQYVSPGQTALTLADDSILEIPVSLEGEDVSRWLNTMRAPAGQHWISGFNSDKVRVAWSESPDSLSVVGRLARVENYDPSTRTFDVVVEIRSDSNEETGFPILDGMFCIVTIPGKTAEQVIPVPRTALASLDSVLVGNDGRLETRKVEVARLEGDTALIAGGLNSGDVVLTGKPPRVLEGMNIDVKLMSPDSVIAMEEDE